MRQNDTCFFCERTITRYAPLHRWETDDQIPDCEFHPVAWNEKTNMSTGFSAPHITELEIHEFVRFYSTRPAATKPRAVADNVVSLSSRSSRTSRAAAKRVFPRTGTLRREIYETIKSYGGVGLTDHELERWLNKKHQTISAARRSLVVDNYLVDSGKVRKNDTGNECTVWVVDETMQQYAQQTGKQWN